MKPSGLSPDDDETISFVVACAFSSAISVSEMKTWCTDVVTNGNDIENIPSYIFDLADFNHPLMHIYKTIGFTPSKDWTNGETYALWGIAAYRHTLAKDSGIDENKAKKYLTKHLHILEKFKSIFPFIEISTE